MIRLVLIAAAAALLAACGLKGPLDRPDPLFGARNQAEIDDPLDPSIDQDEDERMVFPEATEDDPFEDLISDEERDGT